tara:strand:+ start:153 stop:626 length:474 start_codon:yes stop_codon:yes gene_type:complete
LIEFNQQFDNNKKNKNKEAIMPSSKMTKLDRVKAKVKKLESINQVEQFKAPKNEIMVDFVLSKGKEGATYKEIAEYSIKWYKEQKIQKLVTEQNVRTRFRNDFDLASKPPTEKKPNYSSVQYITDYKGSDDIVILQLKKDSKSTRANALRMYATLEK